MIKLTWYGTYSIKLSCDDDKILFDPFIRYEKRNNTCFKENFLNTKNIFITHGHMDHTMDLYNLYKNKDVLIHTTKSVYERLIKEGFPTKKLHKLNYNETYNIGKINIEVLHGKHIRFDFKTVVKTIFNKNMIKYFRNLIPLIKASFKCKEKKEMVNYFITADNKKILFIGSMGINKKTKYPKNIDYLVLAYQGRSDLDKKLDIILKTINPKKVIITHHDNSFPPISSSVDINEIKKRSYIIIPKYEREITLK